MDLAGSHPKENGASGTKSPSPTLATTQEEQTALGTHSDQIQTQKPPLWSADQDHKAMR